MTLPTTGLHDGIPEQEYHADRASLSSTGAKTLLYEGPRIYKHRLDHPVHKDAFDLGSVIHALILGVGEYEVIDADSWRTKAAQEARTTARAEGRAPVLRKDYEAAAAMRDEVMANRLAAGILSEGRPEVSMWHEDPVTGVPMRGRIDWLRDNAFVDVKSVAGMIHPQKFERTAWDLHYHFQAAFYQRILALNGIPDLPPIWLVVSKEAPHEVLAYQPDQDLMIRAHEDVDLALQQYARCLETDTWPGLTPDDQIHTISAPRWAR